MERSNFRTRSPLSQSKSINDKILWANLQRDLIECIQVYRIQEPLPTEYPSSWNTQGDKTTDIEIILQNVGMISKNNNKSKINTTGKVRERMLLSKIMSILTPEKLIPNVADGISFENIMILLATMSNISLPNKENMGKEVRIKNLRDFRQNYISNHYSEDFSNGQYNENKKDIVWRSKYRYGCFNKEGTIVFTDSEKDKIKKEFIAFTTNRRDFIRNKNKEKVEEK